MCSFGQHACGVFLDVQKAFEIVNYDKHLRRFDYYCIKGIRNNWFHSNLHDRMQFTSATGYKSNHRQVKHGVSERSVSALLFFSLSINDLHLAL